MTYEMKLTRRSLLALGSSALAAGSLGLPRLARAAGSIVATTYPGSFDEAFKAVVGPAFAKTSGAGVSFTPLLGVDQIGTIQASRNAPAFEAMKKLLPNVGAIAPSPGALAALFQQGEIDIAFNYWNNVALLAAKGVDIAFAKPKSGAVVVRSSAQIVKNNQDPKAVLDYLDTVMSVETQKGL